MSLKESFFKAGFYGASDELVKGFRRTISNLLFIRITYNVAIRISRYLLRSAYINSAVRIITGSNHGAKDLAHCHGLMGTPRSSLVSKAL